MIKPFELVSNILPIVFADLDDTAFQTERKVPEGVSLEHCMVGSVDKAGAPSGVLTPAQQQMVSWLLSSTEFIPVTARSAEQLDRVTLPFTSWKVMTQGAVILNRNNEYDEEWKAHIVSMSQAWQERLSELCISISTHVDERGLPCFSRVICAYGDVGIYVNVKTRNVTLEGVSDLHRVCDVFSNEWKMQGGWVHVNGNNVSFFIPGISKASAVSFLMSRRIQNIQSRFSLSLGDSLSDLGFMSLSHMMAIPKGSQVSRTFEAFMVREHGGFHG